MSRSVRVIVISEETCEREQLARALNDIPGVAVVAEVDQVCRMGVQAGHVDANCVVLDIDRYPLAGTLGLAQARATFSDARIIILARSIPPRYLRFLRESGASCCIDKDDGWWPTYDKLAWMINAVGLMPPQSVGVSMTRVLTPPESVYNLRRIEALQSVGQETIGYANVAQDAAGGSH